MKEALLLQERIADRPALVLGKGPSLTLEAFASACVGHCVFGINQTSGSFPVDVAFFIDIEPVYEVGEYLLKSDCMVLMPWRPNQRTWRPSRSAPMKSTLLDLAKSDPLIAALESQQRLFYFHTRPPAVGADRNVFPPNLVSLSSLLQILADVGVSEVSTLGVDGGTGYSKTLQASHLLTQLRCGYSNQFPILRKISISKGLTMQRANEAPINVYVGCQPAQRLSARVLEHTILSNTSSPVRIRRIDECALNAEDLAGRTPFSMQRFMIPALNERQGVAVYLDSDMLVFQDIKELVELRDRECAVSSVVVPPGSVRKPQYSVMVIDCAKAFWDAKDIQRIADTNYESVLFELGFEPSKNACLPYQWNSLEHWDSDTRLLHFTDMERQPWLSATNPLAPIWMDAMFKAMEENFVSFDSLVQDVNLGWIRPGILWQAEHGERDPSKLPRREKLKDAMYTPPHTVERFTSSNNKMIRVSLAVAQRLLHWVRGQRNA